MTVEVVEKRKTTVVCGDCGAELASNVSKSDGCTECESKNIKKSLVIVRKSVGDEEDDLDGLPDDEVEDDDEVDDEDSDEDEDDVDDDEEDEEDEDEDEDDDTPASVKKSDTSVLGLEVLNIATAFAENIVKVFSEGQGEAGYEEAMLDINNVMDSAAASWLRGESVAKSIDTTTHTSLIRERVNGIIHKEGKTMPRPKNFDSLDDETKEYIASLEKDAPKDDVENSNITKREDLPEDVQKSLKAADEIVEAEAVRHWTDVAKGYAHVPGNEVEELAKSLRTLSETAPEAFEVLKKSLDAAEEGLKNSEVLKSFGRQGGTEDSSVSKHHSAAQELVSKGEFATVEQAEVHLMSLDGSAYQPTNS